MTFRLQTAENSWGNRHSCEALQPCAHPTSRSVHLVGLKYRYLLSFGDCVSLLCKPSEQNRAFTHSTFADAHRAHSPRGRQSKGWESRAEIANTPFLFSSLRFQTWRKQVCSGLAAASLVLSIRSVSCTFAEPSTYRRSQT